MIICIDYSSYILLMSLQIGRATPRVRINKYIVIEILAYVFKDFQMFELLLKLSRDSYRMAVKNQDLI